MDDPGAGGQNKGLDLLGRPSDEGPRVQLQLTMSRYAYPYTAYITGTKRSRKEQAMYHAAERQRFRSIQGSLRVAQRSNAASQKHNQTVNCAPNCPGRPSGIGPWVPAHWPGPCSTPGMMAASIAVTAGITLVLVATRVNVRQRAL